jgi:ABC-type transporter MlaC component
MKKFLCVLFLSVATVVSALAQQKMPTPEEIAKKNVDELETRLKLSSTQKSVIYNYAYDLAKEQIALMKKQQATGYNDEEVAKMYRLSNETNQNIKAVLRPEQIVEFDKVTEERLNGIDPKKKKKKRKKGEEEEKVVGIEGLKLGKGKP